MDREDVTVHMVYPLALLAASVNRTPQQGAQMVKHARVMAHPVIVQVISI